MVKYSNITKNAQIFLSCSPSEDRSIRYQNFLKLILKISASFAWNAIDQTTSVPRIFNNKINALQTCLEKYGMALPFMCKTAFCQITCQNLVVARAYLYAVEENGATFSFP